MRLEIGIKTYNRPDILRQCIQSIRHFEEDVKITVFNDGSNPPYDPEAFKDVDYVYYPDNKGTNWSNQRFLAYFFHKRSKYWLTIDDDILFTRPFVDDMKSLLQDPVCHVFVDNDRYEGFRPQGRFLAGTYEMFEKIGFFDMVKYNRSYGGCHPSWTWRAIKAGCAAAMPQTYIVQGVPTANRPRKMRWETNRVAEYEGLKNDPTYCPLNFPENYE